MQDQTNCACGCGAVPKPGNRYIHGHNHRGKHLKPVRYVEEDRGYSTPCWVWQLARNNHGYGTYGGSQAARGLAHRLYYEERHGAIPAGLVLDHLCRVPACVNPDHLEAVTQRENCRRGPGGRPRQITDEQIAQMRRMDATGIKRSVIAAEVGCSPTSVTKLLGRKERT